MNSSDWEILSVLAKEKNMTKASERLFIAQPSLSYRLRKVEEEFGAPLFSRMPGGIVLTPEGETVLHYTQKLQALYIELQNELQNKNGQPYGTLRIGVSSVFANSDFPQLLKDFGKAYPNINIHLRTSRSSGVDQALQEGEISVAVTRGEPVWQEEKYLLRQEPVCLAAKEPIRLRDLPNKPQILIPYSGIHAQSIRWWHQHFSVRPHVGMELDNMETGIQMVLHNLGWMILPSMMLRPDMKLFQQPLYWSDGSAFIRKTWLCCRKEALKSPVAAAFVTFLLEREGCK